MYVRPTCYERRYTRVTVCSLYAVSFVSIRRRCGNVGTFGMARSRVDVVFRESEAVMQYARRIGQAKSMLFRERVCE